MFATLANPGYAELEYLWPDNFPKQTQKTIEEKVNAAALKYAKKEYAHLGEYNFLTSKEKYQILIASINQPGEYGIPKDGLPGIVMLDPKLTENVDILAFTAVHELSHAYDFYHINKIFDDSKTFQDRVKAISKVKKIANETQQKAIEHELLYLKELKTEVSDNQYQKVLKWEDHLKILRDKAEKMNNSANELEGLDSEWRKRFDEVK